MISLSHKFIYIHPPKTGGNAIQNLLLPLSDDHKVLHYPIEKKFKDLKVKDDALHEKIITEDFKLKGKYTVHKHAGVKEYRKLLGEDFSKFKTIISVRHPFERALSLYFSPSRSNKIAINDDGSFKRYLPPEWDEAAFKKMVSTMPSLRSYLTDGNVFCGAAFVIRTEELQRHIIQLVSALNLPVDPTELNFHNISTDVNGVRYEIRRDLSLRHWVEDFFSKDMETFGYELAYYRQRA